VLDFCKSNGSPTVTDLSTRTKTTVYKDKTSDQFTFQTSFDIFIDLIEAILGRRNELKTNALTYPAQAEKLERRS
jgi:hypothetical protein